MDIARADTVESGHGRMITIGAHAITVGMPICSLAEKTLHTPRHNTIYGPNRGIHPLQKTIYSARNQQKLSLTGASTPTDSHQ